MQINKKQNGMILVIVLIFLLILSLLATSALSTSYLQMRMNYNLEDNIKLLQAADAGLNAGEKQLTVGQYELKFDGIDVHYRIEQLSNTQCVYNENNRKTGGVYFSITSSAGWRGKDEITLQSTYASPTAKKCVSKEEGIQPGRMSWREY